MAGFPYQYPVFLLDSVSLPNTSPPKMSGSLEEGDFNTPCFSSYLQEPFQEVPLHEANFMGNNTSDNEPSELENCGDQASQKQTPNEKKRITREESSSVSSLSMGVREVKTKKQKKTRNGVEETEQKKNKTGKKDQKKVLEEPPSGYIHVRARRGQATDSHSLAERVRREKISERMKMLQGLVPGCNKVTGKALMLDEIINYVQSLQYQVEFLSMKLASVNPTLYDFGTDLDAFMVTSEKGRSLGSPLQSIHQPNPPTQPTIVADTTARNNSCIQDNAVTFLLQQQGQMEMLNSLSSHQDNGNLYMDVDGQRQRFLNQCSFNNLSSFK